MNPIQHGQQAARQVAEYAEHVNQVVLASYSESEYTKAVARGLVTVGFSEYQARLAGAIQHFEQRGIPVTTVPTTASEMIDTLIENQLPKTPDGFAAAIGIIYHQRRTGDIR